MNDMNVPVEVKSGLKQLKSGVEVENNTIGKSDRTSDGSGSLKSKRLIWRFVYNTCGYHHTPIPSQLSHKLEFAHPSPLFRLLSAYKRLLSTDNLLMVMAKLSACTRYVYNSLFSLLPIQSLYVCNNLNIVQSGTTSTNDISMNSSNNDYNLQSINIENELYNNRLNNCTLNELILMNITKI